MKFWCEKWSVFSWWAILNSSIIVQYIPLLHYWNIILVLLSTINNILMTKTLTKKTEKCDGLWRDWQFGIYQLLPIWRRDYLPKVSFFWDPSQDMSSSYFPGNILRNFRSSDLKYWLQAYYAKWNLAERNLVIWFP